MSGRLVKVRILDGHVVYVDGESRGASVEVEVSAAAAKALIAAGKAEKAGHAARPPRSGSAVVSVLRTATADA